MVSGPWRHSRHLCGCLLPAELGFRGASGLNRCVLSREVVGIWFGRGLLAGWNDLLERWWIRPKLRKTAETKFAKASAFGTQNRIEQSSCQKNRIEYNEVAFRSPSTVPREIHGSLIRQDRFECRTPRGVNRG